MKKYLYLIIVLIVGFLCSILSVLEVVYEAFWRN
jgi:hypothetical protein